MSEKNKEFPTLAVLLALVPVIKLLLTYFGFEISEEWIREMLNFLAAMIGGYGTFRLAKAEPVGSVKKAAEISTIVLMLGCFPVHYAGAEVCIEMHPDGQPYSAHWVAAKADRDAWQARALIAEGQHSACTADRDGWKVRAELAEGMLTPVEPAEPLDIACDEFSDFVDGPEGRLWKPDSEGRGKPVFLLPQSYCELMPDNIDRVHVFNEATGQEIFGDDFRHCGLHNAKRYHHDVPNGGVSDPLVVQLIRADGLIECLTVPNGTKRFD